MMLMLFDIDGTLLRAGGAGRKAMNDAFDKTFDVANAFRDVSFAGSVDPQIFSQACHTAQVVVQPGDLERFQQHYIAALDHRLGEAGEAYRLLPGVPDVLDQAAELGCCALLTGNWRIGAFRKLQDFALWERFAFGVFGGDGQVRDDLVPVARRRAQEMGISVDRVVVIGDTPADVQCARAGDAEVVAVKTGWSSEEALMASSPDLLIEDFVQGAAQLRAFLS